jgi:Caspase domain
VAHGGSATIEVVLGETPDPVKAIRIQVNGRQIAEDVPETGGIGPGKHTYTVPLARGANTITVIAINDTGEAIERTQLIHEGNGLLDNRDTLYILAIGVTQYPKLPGNNLFYSGEDAKVFANAMEKSAGALHKKVEKRILVNGGAAEDEPTRANIIDALDILKNARVTDTVMLFVAGHGINEGLNYNFIPTDAQWTKDGDLRASTLVPWHAFQSAIEGARGTRIMFLDTCHSANAYNPRALNESVNANILVYTSTRWDQLANETNVLGEGHGLFTLAVTEGMRGKAKTSSGEVRAEPLRDFLRAQVAAYVDEANRRIEALNQNIAKPQERLTPLLPQEPQFFKGRDAENYLLAIAN